MKKVLLALFVLTSVASRAQFDRYEFSRDNGTYTELSGAATVTDSWQAGQAIYLDLNNTPVRLFNQTYFVNNVSPIALGFGGFIAAENDTTGVAVDGFLTNLSSMDATSAISTILEPNGNDPILKVQWKNAHPDNGDATDFINFQIWIFTKSGDVEFHIGPNQVNDNIAYGPDVDGPAFGVFLASETFEDVYGTFFLDGNVANPFVNKDKVFETMQGTPENGTIYRFKNEYAAAHVAEMETIILSAYPNPFRSELQVVAPVRGEVNLTDMLGRTVLTQKVHAGKNILPSEGLPQGNYILHFTGERGQSFVKKVQKQ